MSGGSLDYIYSSVEDAARTLMARAEDGLLQSTFLRLLKHLGQRNGCFQAIIVREMTTRQF